jgi:hypothetical protein
LGMVGGERSNLGDLEGRISGAADMARGPVFLSAIDMRLDHTINFRFD